MTGHGFGIDSHPPHHYQQQQQQQQRQRTEFAKIRTDGQTRSVLAHY